MGVFRANTCIYLWRGLGLMELRGRSGWLMYLGLYIDKRLTWKPHTRSKRTIQTTPQTSGQQVTPSTKKQTTAIQYTPEAHVGLWILLWDFW
jgi:hypothetical protein